MNGKEGAGWFSQVVAWHDGDNKNRRIRKRLQFYQTPSCFIQKSI